MKKTFLIYFILFVCQTLLFAQTNLRARLNALISTDFLSCSEVGISVYDLTAGEQLYAYQDKKLYRPASIEKLITGITALDKMGIDYRIKTSLYYTGRIANGQLNGDLYVVGGFDSEFGDKDMDALIDKIVKSGIKRISGSLYGDISMKDSLYWGRGWSWDDNPYYFQPYLSPLMFHKGYVEVIAHPSQKDSSAYISCIPASSFYSLTNRTKTKSISAGKFEVSRNWLGGGNEIVVKGNVSSVQSDKVNMNTSQDFFMHVFRERLELQGISVSGYAYRDCPKDSSVFLGECYHTLGEILLPAMKKSDNLSAEAMFYQLAANKGKRYVGSEDAIKVIEQMIRFLGYAPEKYRIADGSGVSLYNYISPELLLAFLKYAYEQKDIFQDLYKALPVAGVDGTLRYRMKNGNAYNNVRAKTGSVTGVSSLAGYAQTSAGHLLAFVIINQNILKQQEAKNFQNLVCEELCH